MTDIRLVRGTGQSALTPQLQRAEEGEGGSIHTHLVGGSCPRNWVY